MSTRGAGDQGTEPGGAKICLRPARWRKVTGTWTVTVRPSCADALILGDAGFGHHAASCWLVELPASSPTSEVMPSIAQPDIDAVDPDIDPLDEKLDDPRLLRRKQFVPERSNSTQRGPHIGFGQALDRFARAAPCLDDDFGRPKQDADLIDDDLLDLGGRNASDRAVRRSLLQDGLADVIAVEPATLAGVRRRHGDAGGTEDHPLQQGRRLRPCGAPLACADWS